MQKLSWSTNELYILQTVGYPFCRSTQLNHIQNPRNLTSSHPQQHQPRAPLEPRRDPHEPNPTGRRGTEYGADLGMLVIRRVVGLGNGYGNAREAGMRVA